VNIRDDDGGTALYYASYNGHVDIIRALLNHEGVDVNIMDNDGCTALDVACMKPEDGVARLLEEHMEREKRLDEEKPEGSDTTLQEDRSKLLNLINTTFTDGSAALHLASQYGNVERVELRAPVEGKRIKSSHSLMTCAFDGNLEEVLDLLREGANVNSQQGDGITALFFASQEGHLEVVLALLQHNEVDVNLTRDTGATALYTASQNGHVDIVQALLQHGKVDVNLRFHTGSTALYVACQNGHVKVVRALLQHDKVDVNLQCTDGSTAFDVARTKKNHDIVRLLKEHVERKNHYAKIQQDRGKLRRAMETISADPVDVSSNDASRRTTTANRSNLDRVPSAMFS
jgi:ankyrin repeat protein